MSAPDLAIFDDPFAESAADQAGTLSQALALDCCHYGALCRQSITEGIAPVLAERSWYDQAFLEIWAPYAIANPQLEKSAVAALLLAKDVLIPNIDVHPGELALGKGKILHFASNGAHLILGSEECRTFLCTLESLVLRHPLAAYHRVTADQFTASVDRILGFQPFNPKKAPRDIVHQYVLVQSLLQEARTVIAYARQAGIPALSQTLTKWPTQSNRPDDDEMAVVELYFESAIYTPEPRCIAEALDLRGNPGIEEWRNIIREWSAQLAAGDLSTAQIADYIKSANSTIKKVEVGRSLLPQWSLYATFPLGLAGLLLGGLAGGIIGVGLLGAEGISVVGRAVSARLDAQVRAKNGWYLMDMKAK